MGAVKPDNQQIPFVDFENLETAASNGLNNHQSVVAEKVNKPLRRVSQQEDRQKESKIVTMEVRDISKGFEHLQMTLNAEVDTNRDDFDQHIDSSDTHRKVADHDALSVDVEKDTDREFDSDIDCTPDTECEIDHKFNDTDQGDSKPIKNVNQNHEHITESSYLTNKAVTHEPQLIHDKPHHNTASTVKRARVAATKPVLPVSNRVKQVSAKDTAKKKKETKKPAKRGPTSLPDDYPYFDTPYSLARVGGYKCRCVLK